MFDIAIVGAGPAGMAAADTACEHGLRVLVIDEQDCAGGQVLRRPPAAFTVGAWLTQRVYRTLHALYARFQRRVESLTYLNNTSVLGIEPLDTGFQLQLLTPAGLAQHSAARVIVSTGCFDMPLAFSGAQLPGVMATGGLQAFFKSQQLIPGERFLFVGSHPLQLIVANQIAGGGGDVAGVVFTQTPGAFLGLLRRPLVLARQWPNMLFIAGVVLQLIVRRVPLRFGRELLRAEGDECLERVQLVTTARRAPAESIDCDRLGTCFGFLANSDLVRQAGARCRWSQASGGWLAEHDAGMRTSVPGLYVAGETTAVAGAKVATLEGQLAALTAALDADLISEAAHGAACESLRRPLAAAREFAELLAVFSYPGERLLAAAMEDQAYLCKCEEVTVGGVRSKLAANPDVGDLSALKLLTRCGMGHCQGRYCHYQARFLLAQERGLAPASLGGFTARFPCRPATVSALIADLPQDD